MSENPWLTIIGLGEDGADGLSPASLSALRDAEIVMGAARHLGLLSDLSAETITWPVPFSHGVEHLLSLRGKKVAVLASGDPFWFGAGTVLSRHLEPSEWQAFPNLSCFAWAAARMGWALEATTCLGLHAAPLSRLRPHLHRGARIIVTLRDGESPAQLSAYLCDQGFGETALTVLEALGGPRERVTRFAANDPISDREFAHPLCVALHVFGSGEVLTKSSGRSDAWFENDGQITKRPVRALTLSALAPRPGEHLWDIGGGSGSISIEWLLSDPTLSAQAVEQHAERATRIGDNAHRLGVDRLQVVTGVAPQILPSLDRPDAVFVGGGLSSDMLDTLQSCAQGARIVANAVTLESEALLLNAHASLGGTLMKFELSEATPLGTKRGWRAAFPIVQWSAVL